MKIQAILFTLLQAQAVLSADESPQKLTSLADCASSCKTNLRSSASKKKECLQKKCGSPDDIDVEVSRNHHSCVGRCNRLRFGPRKQTQCIQDCDEEYGNDRRSSAAAHPGQNPSGRNPSGQNQDPEQCEARCSKRLRFSHERQQGCIRDCHTDRGADEEEYDVDDISMGREKSTIDEESNLDGVEEGKEEDVDFPGNRNACVSRCNRLRFSQERQTDCVERCGQKDADKRSDSDSQGGEVSNADFPGNKNNNNPCKSRCMKLRFSAERQVDCVGKCPTDDFYARAS